MVSQLPKGQQYLARPHIDMLVKSLELIATHQHLLTAYQRYTTRGYDSIAVAFSNFQQTDDILAYFPEIGKYGIFSVEQYNNLVTKIKQKEADELCDIPFSPYQIILSDRSRRLIIVTSKENKIAIQAYAETYFKSQVTMTDSIETELMIMGPKGIAADYDASVKLFQDFSNYVNHQNQQLCDTIHMIPQKIYCCHKYIQSNLPTIELSPEDLIKCLASCQKIDVLQLNLNSNYCNVNNNGADTTKLTSDWINRNPPLNRELKKTYYARYIATANVSLAVNIFGKLVLNAGFKTFKSNGKNYWVH
jgi:hypothetical protein